MSGFWPNMTKFKKALGTRPGFVVCLLTPVEGNKHGSFVATGSATKEEMVFLSSLVLDIMGRKKKGQFLRRYVEQTLEMQGTPITDEVVLSVMAKIDSAFAEVEGFGPAEDAGGKG